MSHQFSKSPNRQLRQGVVCMVRFRSPVALLILTSFAAAGCSDTTGTSTTNPTTGTTITDTFSGALPQNSAATFQFTTLQAGTVNTTLFALTAPDSDTPPAVGIALGTW